MSDVLRRFVETGCAGCVIDVMAFDGDHPALYVGVLSNHLPVEHWRWLGHNGRLRRAWRILRGRGPYPTIEFLAAEEAAKFQIALGEAVAMAFKGNTK